MRGEPLGRARRSVESQPARLVYRAGVTCFMQVHQLFFAPLPNALESFFGHLKDNLRIHRGLSFEHQQAFVKWYLHFNNEKKKKG